MSRQVCLYVKIKLSLIIEEGIEISDVIEEMEFLSGDDYNVEDTEILEWEVIDSK
jgi:hypothetical protein